MTQRMTRDFLSEQGACSDQMELFTELFPNGTEVTRRLCEEHAEQFDFNWAARYLLPKEAWQEYLHTRGEAWAEYDRIRREAWAEYERILDEAWAEYGHTDRAEYERIAEKALAEYGRIVEKEWTECRRIRAIEFARLWNKYMSD